MPMQDKNIEFTDHHLPDGETGRYTVTINLLNWTETIVAHYAQDERMQALLEQRASFHERVAALCLRKPVQALSEKEKELGSVLVKAGCGRYGKRFVSMVSGVSPIQAQKLLNQFYAVFNQTKNWIILGNQDFAPKVVERLLYRAIDRCVASLPNEWQYLSELTFSLPVYAYEKQSEKFFKHHFENELEIGGALVRLSVEVRFD